MDLGVMIQYYRTKNGMTQKDLASGICSISYLSKMENGSIQPKDDLAELLFERLDISFSEITSYDEDDINKKIQQLYKKIQQNDHDSSTSLVEELERIITPFHRTETQNFFLLVHFYYLINERDSEKFSLMAPEVLRLENTFYEEKKYYYCKIIGLYYQLISYPNKSNEYFEKARFLLEEHTLKDPEIYYLLALSLTSMKKPAYSNYYCQMATDQFANEFLYSKVTDCYILYGINYTILEAYDLAENYLKQVLHSKPMGHTSDVREQAKHYLAVLSYWKEEYDVAINFFDDTVTEDLHSDQVLEKYLILSKINYIKGELDQAKEYLNKGKELLKKEKHVSFQHRFFILDHQIHGTIGEFHFIRKAEKVLLPFFEETEDSTSYNEVVQILANIHYDREEFQVATEYFKKLMIK
ncbi:hypothetical protein CEY16_09875 [Halalkalibacillus sediminis]|uniref:HTH cro/C1-type domain-containing protein n=1 Tax=Halalkalibacillus sediminis TaxID=2018042 RepID=A0A2I0QRT5_9BACI|nr:helix-turn-helix transcriptional regulator [Halalkalibacillus sediminis]PKR77046.1 hypothetical protein CEY16_09875 [Halalkalibacillus sediminis]